MLGVRHFMIPKQMLWYTRFHLLGVLPSLTCLCKPKLSCDAPVSPKRTTHQAKPCRDYLAKRLAGR